MYRPGFKESLPVCVKIPGIDDLEHVDQHFTATDQTAIVICNQIGDLFDDGIGAGLFQGTSYEFSGNEISRELGSLN